MLQKLSGRAIVLFKDFFEGERAGGLVLLLCTLASLSLTNSGLGTSWLRLWEYVPPLLPASLDLRWSIGHWINDGLMTIFFLLVGLEIERELYVGELASPRRALLPIVAACGGMIVPILLYASLHLGRPTLSGFGIPMATDIAFSLGVLSLVGRKAPVSLRIFLSALAIIDDLGAILVITLFYAHDLSLDYLLATAALLLILFILNHLRVTSLVPYLLGGLVLWYCIYKSGIHPTITGVALAFLIPFNPADSHSPSRWLEKRLLKPVIFLILPLFALANTAILLPADTVAALNDRVSIGIMLGLLVGKVVGIFTFTYLFVVMGIGSLPIDISWRQLLGVSLLGGIGFTMSIFITYLAFTDAAIITAAKLSILLASAIAAMGGYAVLKSARQPPGAAEPLDGKTHGKENR